MERILKSKTGRIRRVSPPGSIRWLVAAGLACAIFIAMPHGGLPGAAWGQTLPGGIEEFRARNDLRDSQQAGRTDETVRHALAYLQKFPKGRFYDEMLLALADARNKQGRPNAALRVSRNERRSSPRPRWNRGHRKPTRKSTNLSPKPSATCSRS